MQKDCELGRNISEPAVEFGRLRIIVKFYREAPSAVLIWNSSDMEVIAQLSKGAKFHPTI